MTNSTDRLIDDILNKIGNRLDREAGLPVESDAPRLIKLLQLGDRDKVMIIDIVNDINDDRYHQRGIFKKTRSNKK